MIKDNKRNFFTAGELAGIFNISKQSLLYYDKVQLLSPDFISENGYRHYSVQQFLDLEIIVNLRALDISIANIKEYLTQRSKQNFAQVLAQKKAECEEIIRKNQEICKTIASITSEIATNEKYPCRDITLTWHKEHLLRVTPLTSADDAKKRIAKFAQHTLKQAHNKAVLPNHTGWLLTIHKKVIKKLLPAGLYLELVFQGTFYHNGAELRQRIQKFLQANQLRPLGDVYVLPYENHWFTEDCDQYISKIFLHVEYLTPHEN